MEFKIEAWLREYNRSLAAELGSERYAGNQGVRKNKPCTAKQLEALHNGQRILKERRANNAQANTSS